MSEEAADFKHAIRNVDEDISKCEEFLCKVLNARLNTPLQLTALQNALDNHRLMATTKQVNTPPVRGQKSAKHLTTPPVKLSRAVVTKNLENDFKQTQRQKRSAEKVAYRSRATSCCSERSFKPSPLIEAEEEHSEDITIDFKSDKKHCKLQSSSNTVIAKRSWSQLLAENNKSPVSKMNNLNILPGTFSQFDPLRTLHFLTKELQSKLYSIAPEEIAIHRILLEIQNSIHRLPISSKAEILAGNSYSENTYFNHSYIQSSQTCQFTQTSALAVVHQYCQTDENTESVKQQQKDLELQVANLELSNKKLSEVCALAKNEKDQMAETLKFHESNNKMLLEEIEELRKRNGKDDSFSKAEEVIAELKHQNNILLAEKEALVAEHNAKLSIADETLEHIKNNKRSEYSSLMQYKLELDKKNTVINAKNVQLDILTKELERVREVVKNKMCDLSGKGVEENRRKSSNQLIKICDNYCNRANATTTSSLSTLPESLVTKAPSLELRLNNNFKSRSDPNGGGTFLSRNYDLNDRSSTKLLKAHDDSSQYSLNKRYSDRKYRPSSHKEKDYELRLKTSMRSNKSAEGDTTLEDQSRSNFIVSDIFGEIRQEVCKNSNVTLPSPPRNFNRFHDVSSESQWSDSL